MPVLSLDRADSIKCYWILRVGKGFVWGYLVSCKLARFRTVLCNVCKMASYDLWGSVCSHAPAHARELETCFSSERSTGNSRIVMPYFTSPHMLSMLSDECRYKMHLGSSCWPVKMNNCRLLNYLEPFYLSCQICMWGCNISPVFCTAFPITCIYSCSYKSPVFVHGFSIDGFINICLLISWVL